ncbi:MAG: cyclic nucleotide-binding domain-containing protein [Hyphomicrobiales bacterium]|nr:cyclic nucleotide-binding domain-containing protein [Hyphomicrobiales bacterium]
MRVVRAALLLGWLVLVASLLYDPFTQKLTSPDNLASPFRIGGSPALLQGVPLAPEPYPMGNRIFWTMLVPIVPLLLMLFGHETWRRICPLSFVSQIPRVLGWQRKVKTLNRSAGKVDRILALIPNDSWMRRNHYYFQFCFLSLGVLGRTLFYNSDRLTLFSVILCILVLAFTVGLVYGGKTWCNYFCPVAVIQAVYTGPGGLLDSKAHLAETPIVQSMCRAPLAGADHSACVGCTLNCPDADLENSYWKRLESEPKRFVYYGLFGLIFAFNTYFYLYSGGWSYYFSGAWTHEGGQFSRLLAPGLFIAGRAWPIPKIVAAPLYFVVCIAASYALFALGERLYARLSARFGKPLKTAQLRHRMFTVSAFLSITLFYVFAGRSNLVLLPVWAQNLVDFVIAAVTITWLIASLSRNADIYLRERLGKTLRQQLVRMGFRSEDVLEGRPIDELSAEEVYVLAKTLPNFSAAQKREAYRHILVDALDTGQTRSSDSLQLLRDVREQLGLTDADHAAILESVGVQDPALLDTDEARSIELRLRRDGYRKFLVDLAQRGLASNAPPAVYLASPAAAKEIELLRGAFGVSEEEHARILAEVTHDDARYVENALKLLDAFREVEAFRFSLSSDGRPEARLVRHALLLRLMHLIHDVVAVVASIDAADVARSVAQTVYMLSSHETDAALMEATASAPADIRDAFRSPTEDKVFFSYADVVEALRPADEVLRVLAADRDAFVGALAVSGLATPDPANAAALVDELWPRDAAASPFLEELRKTLRLGRRPASVAVMAELLSVEAFTALDLRALSNVAAASTMQVYEAGDQICRAGADSDSIFLLVSGETETWVEGEEGRIVLGRGAKGTVFGELGVIARRPRSASVEVVSASASGVSIPKAIIDDLLERDLPAARGFLKVVSGYLINTISTTVHSSHPAASPSGA